MLDTLAVAKQIVESIDVDAVPVSIKLRVVEALLEIKRLDNASKVDDAAPKLVDTTETSSAGPARWSPMYGDWTVAAWFANVRARGRIGAVEIGNTAVAVPNDVAYRDYCDTGSSVGYAPLAINVFGRKIHASPRFITRKRIRVEAANRSNKESRSWIYYINFC
jgi:hypothetical protein